MEQVAGPAFNMLVMRALDEISHNIPVAILTLKYFRMILHIAVVPLHFFIVAVTAPVNYRMKP